MKTKNDIIRRALRVLGVVAHDEVPTADMVANAGDVIEGLISEMSGKSPLVPFSLDRVPDAAFLPLADLLAAHIAGDYEVAPPVSRASAWLRVRSVFVTDDRPEAGCDVRADYGNC